ncbi:hypothetical protein SAMN05216204_11896 [Massilia yuzhufengensis]|uniref:Uncharacterized protein n=1 Tax=Massilia yuzhufengensis TaxID=1164594 RepID=A0A1I1Q9Z1_9BURK|nr:hypothetical protein SAMN05216204_11896 [Massilia yuzhufengensis]
MDATISHVHVLTNSINVKYTKIVWVRNPNTSNEITFFALQHAIAHSSVIYHTESHFNPSTNSIAAGPDAWCFSQIACIEKP